MAAPAGFSKNFPLDAGIFNAANLTLGASTDANAAEVILNNSKFPDGDIALGHIAVTADTGKVSLKPAAADGASVSFDLTASAQSGLGVYGKSVDAIKALSLANSPAIAIADAAGQRYLLLDCGCSISLSGSASHPIGALGTLSFGVDTKAASTFAVLHRFDASQGARDVIADTIGSWRLPRNVAYDGHDVNLKPGTWLLAEADGSLALKLAASLGWNVNFAKDAKLLGVTHNLSAKIDASLTANFGFSVSGQYVVVVGRESAAPVVRLQIFKQSSKGLNFGLNLSVGVQGADPQLPANFNDFIKTTFGVHGLQVLTDLQQWTASSTDLGQKLAGLADQTVLDLLKNTTGIDPAADLAAAKQALAGALNTWTSLPGKLSSMLWSFLDKQAGAGATGDFKTFLTALAANDPQTRATALATALQQATLGNTAQGQFLEAVADQGLLALANDLGPASAAAGKVLDLLNGGIIAKLQTFINQKLDLTQIDKAVQDANLGEIDQWLQNRLGNFLDKTLGLDELKGIQQAIQTLNTKIASYYATAVQALTKHYSASFAATYQETVSGSTLLDVNFDLSVAEAAALFDAVVAKSNLDNLLIVDTKGVTLNQAKLTHDINRTGTIDLNLPNFDFSSTHVSDAMATLTAEDQGGRLLLYQANAKDSVTIKNRAASQLSVLASLNVAAGQSPQLSTEGSIAYEMSLVKAGMRPLDLESRTTTFLNQYLNGLFSGDASVASFYTDLDNAVTSATHSEGDALGDMAISMQLSLKASALAGWFVPRNASQLRADQMRLSLTLQGVWKQLLPALYFTDLNLYQPGPSVAALLVWSSLPVSTSIDFDDPTINKFNTDKDVFWDWPQADLRHAIARDSHTVTTLTAKLATIQGQLQKAGSGNAGFFNPAQAGSFIEQALDSGGDVLLSSLLFTEAQLVTGATNALKQISATLATAATAPTQAIETLAQFAADLTDAFNDRVNSTYSGMSARVVGPMMLVESSVALGSADVKPAAILTLYALNQGHSFDLGTFITGTMPPPAEVALTQTLVSLSS